MNPLYHSGEIVYSKKPPNVKLVVRRFVDDVYYCKVFNHPGNKEQSYYERDLKASTNPAEKRRPELS